jgi:hypothetical protein
MILPASGSSTRLTGELDLYYLLSLGSPYQIQLMHTTLRLKQ